VTASPTSEQTPNSVLYSGQVHGVLSLAASFAALIRLSSGALAIFPKYAASQRAFSEATSVLPNRTVVLIPAHLFRLLHHCNKVIKSTSQSIATCKQIAVEPLIHVPAGVVLFRHGCHQLAGRLDQRLQLGNIAAFVCVFPRAEEVLPEPLNLECRIRECCLYTAER